MFEGNHLEKLVSRSSYKVQPISEPQRFAEELEQSDEQKNYLAFEPGFTIAGRYVIQGSLGSGSRGRVYKALDTEIGRTVVAIKVLNRKFSTPKNLKRFLKEAELMHQISHRSLVRTYAFGTDRDLVFYTMELIDGLPLSEILENQGVQLADVSDYALQLCAGLEAIHNRGVVHRDLKPANILITKNKEIKIADFGIAHCEDSDLTEQGELLGSASYIAPEVWLGQETTPAVDIYALGIILYELATGSLPFLASSPAALMRSHLDSIPPQPRERNARVPLWLNDLIMSLLEKSPEKRPRSVRQISSTIVRHTEFSDKEEEPQELTSPTPERKQIGWGAIIASSATSSLIVGLITFFVVTQSPWIQGVGAIENLNLMEELDRSRLKVTSLTEELRAVKTQLEEKNSLFSEASASNPQNVVQAELERQDLLNKELSTALSESRKKTQELRGEITDLQTELERQSSEKAKLERKIEKGNQLLIKFKQEFEQLRSELLAVHKDLNSAEQALGAR